METVHHTLDINSFTGCPAWAWATLSLCLTTPSFPLGVLPAAGKAARVVEEKEAAPSRFEDSCSMLLSQLSTWESSASNGLVSVAFFQGHTECTLIALL